MGLFVSQLLRFFNCCQNTFFVLTYGKKKDKRFDKTFDSDFAVRQIYIKVVLFQVMQSAKYFNGFCGVSCHSVCKVLRNCYIHCHEINVYLPPVWMC